MNNKTLALAAALALTACGYTPLYQPVDGTLASGKVQVGNVVMDRLADRNVGERRVAQEVDQHLRQDYPSTGPSMDTVNITLHEDSNALALRRTALVEREQLVLTGRVTITSPEGKELLKTDISSVTAYNVETTPYGTESGKTFARLTAARNLAEEISRRLALYYRARPAQ